MTSWSPRTRSSSAARTSPSRSWTGSTRRRAGRSVVRSGLLLLAALGTFGACQRASGPSAGGPANLRPAYVRLDALLSSAPGSAVLAALADDRRLLTQPPVGAPAVALPDRASAGGSAGGSWIDRAARATETATARQHALQQESLDKAIERRVARQREQLEADFTLKLAQQQDAERRSANESRAAAMAQVAPRLSDAQLRLWLLERRKDSAFPVTGPFPLTEPEAASASAALAEVQSLERELSDRLAAIDAGLTARLKEIETTQRAAMESALNEYRDREWARARELGEVGAQRLEDVSRQARERLAALATVVEPATLSVELPAPPPEPADRDSDRPLAVAAAALDRSQRDLAGIVRWETAQRVKAAGLAHGFSIRFQRPPAADWPDVTEQARQWLAAEIVR